MKLCKNCKHCVQSLTYDSCRKVHEEIGEVSFVDGKKRWKPASDGWNSLEYVRKYYCGVEEAKWFEPVGRFSFFASLGQILFGGVSETKP